MYKIVLRDYFYHFKDAFKNIYWSDWFLYFYITFLMPVLLDIDYGTSFYSCFIPLMLALLLSRMYSGVMPKAFFLCPLTAKERQAYAKAGMHIRIALPLILFLILNIIALAKGTLPFYMFTAKLLLFTTACIAYNVYCQPIRNADDLPNRKFGLKGNFEFWNSLVQITTIIVIFILCSFEYNEELWELIITGILVAVQMYVCIRTIVTFYPQVINQATYYEFNPRVKASKR